MEITWHMIVAAVGATATASGGALRWFLSWVDKRDQAFLLALEASQKRLEAVNDRRVEDARTYASALSDAVNDLRDALEKRKSERPPNR